jgi:glucokinase
VLLAPNLSWRDEPLRDGVAERVGLPVVVENDANAAAWAEYRFGAGRGEEHLVLVTVGTGIGGGIVLDGRLHRGRHGIGARSATCRWSGTAGAAAAACAAAGSSTPRVGRCCTRRATSPARSASADVGWLELGGGTLEGIESVEVTQAAREGDPAALECFEVVGGWLGQGMADLAAVLDPEVFLLGGGVSDAGELLLGPAARPSVPG